MKGVILKTGRLNLSGGIVTNLKCEHCGQPYVPTMEDPNCYAPSCDCWYKNVPSNYDDYLNMFCDHEQVEPYFAELEYDDEDDSSLDYIENDSDWIASNELYREKINEEAAFQEYTSLKMKYAIGYNNPMVDLPLYRILSILEGTEIITENDICWLIFKNFFPLVAECYLHNYHLKQDAWYFVKACRFFRKAGNPQKTLSLTNHFLSHDKDIMAAIYTTRGGAFRDIGNPQYAIECGNKALNMKPDDYFAFNLLGAANFQLYNWEKGHVYFERARNLGSKTFYQTSLLDSVLDKMDDENKRKEAAMFLLQKNPVFYSWAQNYIGGM